MSINTKALLSSVAGAGIALAPGVTMTAFADENPSVGDNNVTPSGVSKIDDAYKDIQGDSAHDTKASDMGWENQDPEKAADAWKSKPDEEKEPGTDNTQTDWNIAQNTNGKTASDTSADVYGDSSEARFNPGDKDNNKLTSLGWTDKDKDGDGEEDEVEGSCASCAAKQLAQANSCDGTCSSTSGTTIINNNNNNLLNNNGSSKGSNSGSSKSNNNDSNNQNQVIKGANGTTILNNNNNNLLNNNSSSNCDSCAAKKASSSSTSNAPTSTATSNSSSIASSASNATGNSASSNADSNSSSSASSVPTSNATNSTSNAPISNDAVPANNTTDSTSTPVDTSAPVSDPSNTTTTPESSVSASTGEGELPQTGSKQAGLNLLASAISFGLAGLGINSRKKLAE
ncbi:hypothetical protein FP435_00430 (plasmid) [Lactobacillus sp. PV037]|uniref:LPXTG cell wall anchor domain-containing protein n=1 Tax=Lactobacillus sp. PV037 TaxID=2594496 RepID=UPI0022408633|nr:hypothetical protein [Lactobacillus sp. PV037]QNQ83003.1 hypothetical protein FP435_00430 [Lactobacillus sp. PV037]